MKLKQIQNYLSWFFLFFLATLLYIDESLWFLKLYFEFIRFGVVFFSSPLQVVSLSLSLIVSAWFLFELILNYFGSKNLSLYHNTILAMLTNQHSVHFGPLHLFVPFQSISIYRFNLFQFTSVLFGLLWSTLGHLVLFGLLWSPILNSSHAVLSYA